MGNDTQQILNTETVILGEGDLAPNYTFNITPSEILVNGEKVNYIDYYVYNLTLEINNITIKFNQTLTNCNVMFSGLSNISNITFIHFDT